MLFNILQCKRAPPEQSHQAQNVNGTEVEEPFPGLRVEAPALPGKMLVVRQLGGQFSWPAPGGFLHTWWVHSKS